MSKKLAVFDFDHTIVDDNSDIVARKLLRVEVIPEYVKALYKIEGWTVYMREIFKLLHKHNFTEETIRKAIIKMPAVNFIPNLIKTMYDKLNFDIIIISDSNSVFINDWLNANNLNQQILEVFTNPAKYNENGLLEIEMFHVQHECKLSTVNLCKGKIMDDFVEKQAASGVNYSQIVYVGDGKNDFCPILRLNKNGLACVRAGFACVGLVNKTLEGKTEYSIKSNVCVWKDGNDILKMLSNSEA